MKSNLTHEKKTIIKAIFAWEDEKEEKWLEEMAANGWRLEKVYPYVYTFRRSAPEKIVYRLDYMASTGKNYKEYLTLFKDAGWELLASFAGWHYFRINAQNGNVPEIYNSDRAKAQKYRRLFFTALTLFLLLINPLLQMIDRTVHADHLLLRLAFDGFFWLFILFAIYGIIRIWLKIRKLESKHLE